MRDAIGGIPNLVIIVVFLVLVSGYLAFTVNYTKAFRVKNKIISTLEQYEGKCDDTSNCRKEISSYIDSLGYGKVDFKINEEGRNWVCRDGYCFTKFTVNGSSSPSDVNDFSEIAYFKVVTRIDINIPIINKIMPHLRIFQVSGNTKPIEMEW